jgi:hypothetical protein
MRSPAIERSQRPKRPFELRPSRSLLSLVVLRTGRLNALNGLSNCDAGYIVTVETSGVKGLNALNGLSNCDNGGVANNTGENTFSSQRPKRPFELRLYPFQPLETATTCSRVSAGDAISLARLPNSLPLRLIPKPVTPVDFIVTRPSAGDELLAISRIPPKWLISLDMPSFF